MLVGRVRMGKAAAGLTRLAQLSLLLLSMKSSLWILGGSAPTGATSFLDRGQKGLENPAVGGGGARRPCQALILRVSAERVVWRQLQSEGGAAAALPSVVGTGAVLV